MARATFAAGCFWGVEEAFRQVDGVLDTTVGYTGGAAAEPTYEQVCAGTTGHAEAVQIDFDPDTVSYEQLLEVFWTVHDPTQRNRQGADVGSQYRSAVFAHDQTQEQAAERSKDEREQAGQHRKPLATEIVRASAFYPAEDYHQQYLAKKGMASCHLPPRD